MGQPYAAPHPRWWRGPTSSTRGTQDDLAVLTRTLKRAKDDAPGALTSAKRLRPDPGGVQIRGTIGTPADVDVYTFTTAGGPTRAWATTPGMLTATITLLNAHGRLVRRLTPDTQDTTFGLPAGTYRVRVQSTGGYNNLGSYEVDVLNIPPAPAAPTATSSSPHLTPTVTLHWTYPASRLKTTAFDVFRSSDNGVTFTPVGNTQPGETTFTDSTSLAADGSYLYRLVASDRGSTSAPGRTSSVHTAPGVQFVAATAPAVLPEFFAAADDFNGDGKADVVSGYGGVYLSNGDGSFSGPVATGPQPTQYRNGTYYFVIDLNRDGHPDLLSVSTDPSAIVTYFGNGDGTFRPLSSTSISPAISSRGAAFIRLDDFTGDGQPDAFDGPDGLLFVGEPDGSFHDPVHVPLDAGLASYLTGDFNGDGRADLASFPYAYNGPALIIRIGNGDGTFQTPIPYGSAADNYRYTSDEGIVINDFDQDGRDDVAIADRNDPALVHILYGTPSGTLVEKRSAGLHADGDFIALDVDDDGQLDLVRLSRFPFSYNAPSVALSQPDHSFTSSQALAGDMTSALYIYAVGDFDGDGRTDLLVDRYTTDAHTTTQLCVLFNRTPIGGGA
jgi:hypothetical protein